MLGISFFIPTAPFPPKARGRRGFDRRFREVFGTNPRTFLIKTRIQAACETLRTSDKPIAEIALDFGFCDQSAFTQHFRRHMGLTPAAYRKRG